MRGQGLVLVASLALLFAGSAAASDLELRAALRADQLEPTPQRLGSVDVPGVGEVSLVANRKGAVIELTAVGPQKTPLGRSETTMGLLKSPIYLRTPDGLKKITVIWKPVH